MSTQILHKAWCDEYHAHTTPKCCASDCPACHPVVYLAARYSRRDEMMGHAVVLHELGYTVRAEWITGKHDGTPDQRCAEIDQREVAKAQIVISFTEPPGASHGRARGGRHVEFGIALAMEKRCIVVGYRENVFHHLPQVEFYETFSECIKGLTDTQRLIPGRKG